VTVIPPTVLVIDDDRTMLSFVAMVLKQEGYSIHKASSGEQAIELMETIQPALIVCDWMMPGLTGLEVCHYIKSHPAFASTFFILLTAREEVADRIQGLDMGADEFFSKPVNASELRARVRAGLRLYQSTQDLKLLAQNLEDQKKLLETELTEAADYVCSLLPASSTADRHGVQIQSYFLPSKQLGGDFFDYHWLDEHRLRFYLMDTAGHGLRAALFSVSLQNYIKSFSLANNTVDICNPSQMLRLLNETFQMEDHHDQYVTLWYGIFDRRTQQLTYSNAGHPPAALIHCDTLKLLPSTGLPIGILDRGEFRSITCTVQPGSSLYIFSDGLYELADSGEELELLAEKGESYGIEQFLELLQNFDTQEGQKGLNWVPQSILRQVNKPNFVDDCSLLQIQFNRLPCLP